MPLGVGIESQQIARVSAALAAAGAWDATPLELYTVGAVRAMLQITYTEGAGAGAFALQLQSSIYSITANAPAGAGEWADASAYAVGAVVGGADVTSLIQGNVIQFTPVGAGAETFTFGPIELDGLVQRLRIPAHEVGVVGTPGTLQLTILLV